MSRTDIVPSPTPAYPLAPLMPEVDSARAYAAAARSDATRRLYSREWSTFVAWCEARVLVSLPASPDVVACYVASMADAGRKPAGIDAALAAISQAHHAGGHDGRALRGSAPVRAVRAGVRRTLGTAQRQAAPLTSELVAQIIEHDAAGLVGVRDRALLLVAHVTMMRASELAALEVRDARFCARGVEVTIRRSKTDQEGAGRVVAVAEESIPQLCPVRALRAWLAASGLTEGALFRAVDRWGSIRGNLSRKDIARRVKLYTARLGLNAKDYSSHSLRAGGVTSAAHAGRSERAIMKATGHKSRAMVDRYIRDADRWADVAGAGLLSRVRGG